MLHFFLIRSDNKFFLHDLYNKILKPLLDILTIV